MKKKTYLFALMAMALTLGSCSDNENGIGGETSKYITVSTSIGNMTRVATDEKGGQTFEEGDEISVYAWTGDATVAPETRERVVNNAINKLTNGSWVSTPQMLWKNNRDNSSVCIQLQQYPTFLPENIHSMRQSKWKATSWWQSTKMAYPIMSMNSNLFLLPLPM